MVGWGFAGWKTLGEVGLNAIVPTLRHGTHPETLRALLGNDECIYYFEESILKSHEKLRKISDSVFQEAEPPENRKSKPFEWRRSFNTIYLPLKNLKIVTSCSVHETEFDWEEERSTSPLKLVKTNISDKIAITGILDEDQIRDHIYCAVENKKEEGVFSVERVAGLTEVSINLDEPAEESEQIPAGLYMGHAHRINFEPGEDDLCFSLCIPKDQILSLITAIRADENATIEVAVHLLSFTYEVDDFVREPYHPRVIVINKPAACFVSWVAVTSKIGSHSIQVGSENEDDKAYPYDEEQITLEQRSHQELLQVLLSYQSPLNNLVTALSKPLNNLVIALWILIVVIVVDTIF